MDARLILKLFPVVGIVGGLIGIVALFMPWYIGFTGMEFITGDSGLDGFQRSMTRRRSRWT